AYVSRRTPFRRFCHGRARRRTLRENVLYRSRPGFGSIGLFFRTPNKVAFARDYSAPRARDLSETQRANRENLDESVRSAEWRFGYGIEHSTRGGGPNDRSATSRVQSVGPLQARTRQI